MTHNYWHAAIASGCGHSVVFTTRASIVDVSISIRDAIDVPDVEDLVLLDDAFADALAGHLFGQPIGVWTHLATDRLPGDCEELRRAFYARWLFAFDWASCDPAVFENRGGTSGHVCTNACAREHGTRMLRALLLVRDAPELWTSIEFWMRLAYHRVERSLYTAGRGAQAVLDAHRPGWAL